MGFIGDMFDNSKGAGFQAQSADLVDPYSGMAQEGVVRSNDALNSQAGLINALRAQNGLGNQSNLYNQYGQIAQGQGPNPAAAMLSQATGQNVAQMGAMAGSQRGASANPALLARQVAQQGSAIQQNSANQAAVMQANQQLAALGAQGQLANQMASNQIGAQNQYAGNAMNQMGQQIGANVAMNQSNIQNVQQQNAANAGIAGLNTQGQQQMFGKVTGGLASGLMAARGGMIPNYYADGGITDFGAGNAPSMPMPQMPDSKEKGGSAMESIAKLAPLLLGAQGGIADYSNGNHFDPNASAPSSFLKSQMGEAYDDGVKGGSALKSKFFADKPDATPQGTMGMTAMGAPTHTTPIMQAQGGRVPSLVSPGEKIIPASEVPQVASGKERAIDAGQRVPGKPKVPGAQDSYANDTVRADLPAGSIVLPRSVTQSKNPGKEAAKFVQALLSKQKKGAS